MKAEGTDMANRLAREKSPYLLQHAENPVDWYAWGPEALDRAGEDLVAGRRTEFSQRRGCGSRRVGEDDVDPTRPLREQRVCLRPRAKPPGPEPRRCAAAVSECVPFLRELARGRRGHGKRKPGTRRDFAPPVCRGLSVAGAASSAAQ